jgi:hypothetical protein
MTTQQLIVVMLRGVYAECCTFVVVLSVIMLSVVTLSVVAPKQGMGSIEGCLNLKIGFNFDVLKSF